MHLRVTGGVNVWLVEMCGGGLASNHLITRLLVVWSVDILLSCYIHTVYHCLLPCVSIPMPVRLHNIAVF